jgi:hypothetical protein
MTRSRVLALALAGIVGPASAGMETDRRVGMCTMYLLVTKNAGAEDAYALADNQERALHFGKKWAQDLKRYERDKVMSDGLVRDAVFACGKIGIRPADYR